METMILSLKRKTIPVALELEDGTKEQLTLQELTGAQRDTYLSLMAKRMSFGPDGKPGGIKDFTGLHSQFLTLALVDAKGDFVPEARIQSFPSKVVQSLFKAAQSLSGMDEGGKEEAKND